jgi:acetyl/propionyl-CoA carboxylase alpha subunit
VVQASLVLPDMNGSVMTRDVKAGDPITKGDTVAQLVILTSVCRATRDEVKIP